MAAEKTVSCRFHSVLTKTLSYANTKSLPYSETFLIIITEIMTRTDYSSFPLKMQTVHFMEIISRSL